MRTLPAECGNWGRRDLANECEHLYASLFRKPAPYVSIIRALGTRRRGLTREEISRLTGLPLNGDLVEHLLWKPSAARGESALEECGGLLMAGERRGQPPAEVGGVADAEEVRVDQRDALVLPIRRSPWMTTFWPERM